MMIYVGRKRNILRGLGVLGGVVCMFYILRDSGSAKNAYDVRQAMRSQNENGNSIKERILTAESSANDKHFRETLSHVLIPRVVGTPSHSKVKEFIKEEIKNLGWAVTLDKFKDKTPIFGELAFENIIAKLNPHAKQTVVLACHYDSKYFTDIEFVGATDSAVPCSMLLNLAHCLQKELQLLKNVDTSLELWFLDGEEAFEAWSPTDSIYGARHLATKLGLEGSLSSIKCLVLLDLLGTKNPTMFNYYQENDVYGHLVTAETGLSNEGLLKRKGSRKRYFTAKWAPHYVEDDHTPFLHRGVPVVHMIPSTFPTEWHTAYDNIDAIDMDTVHDLNKIMRLFVLSYFKL